MRKLGPLAAAVLISLLALSGWVEQAEAKPWIGVRGNQLIDGAGKPVRLLGVNRSGTEYRCSEEDGFFEGPSDTASIEAMKSWHINSVRVPLNESCWLGLGGIPAQLSGSAYRAAVRGFVERLEAAGLYVILDLHWAAPGHNRAGGLIAMPDADHALDFWRSVANEYREDRSVIFDLFNEPRPGITWECWEDGCENEDEFFGRYPVVGMKAMVEAVRSTGAEQPLVLSGLAWAQNLRGWLAHVPSDPDHALVAANHTYGAGANGITPCLHRCKRVIERIHRTYPVITTEFGQMNCRDGYSVRYMRWADRQHISYLAWAWNTGPGWSCTEGPSLISDYSGTPTEYGIGFREHLAALWRARR
ncbi:MAG TPA: glycoside hydrolase family 5 protein [Solirubrobacterales bacterium]|nr:glycoside hydrolase family 5 protein [Solirubrobacterales bacterium]